MIIDSGFVQDFLEEKSLFEICYYENQDLLYHNSIKTMVDDNFFVSRYFNKEKTKCLFNIYAVKGKTHSLRKILARLFLTWSN